MKNKIVKYAIIAVSVLVIIAAAWFVKAKFFTKPKAPAVITAEVTSGDVEKTVLATGVLEPYQLVSVGAQTSGRVTKLAVALGDYVNKGDLIAEIDSQSQINTLESAKAKIAAVQAQIQQTEASLKEAQLNYDRQRRLYAQDAGSKADLESAEADYKSQVGSLKNLKAQLEEAILTRDSAQLNVGYTRITAPISGTVLAIVTKEGQTINSNQTTPTIVKLGETNRMTIKAEISEADVINVKPGMEVFFTTLGDADRKYRAVLRSIAPAPVTIEDSDTLTPSTNSNAIYYMGIFDVDNADGALKTFMTAQVNIILQSAKNVLTIPSTALGQKNANGTYQVKVLEAADKIAIRNIKIGVNDGTNVQVISGLKKGEKVVTVDSSSKSSSGDDFKGPPGMGGL